MGRYPRSLAGVAFSLRYVAEKDRLSLLRALDTAPYFDVRRASNALLQSIELAVAAEELGLDGAYFRVHHFARQLVSPQFDSACASMRTRRDDRRGRRPERPKVMRGDMLEAHTRWPCN